MYDYDYYDYYDYSENFATAATAGFAIIGVILLLTLAIGIMMYLFSAIGYYKMAKRLNVSAAWLAFIPVGNIYITGRVAQEPVYGQKKLPYGWILLGLHLFTNLISVGSMVATIRNIIDYTQYMDAETPFDIILSIFGGYFAGGFLSVIASIAYTVFYYIALYHVFKNFAPDNATLYLVLSILFSFLTPFFVFAIRNKPIGGGYGYNGGYGGYNTANNGYNQGYYNQGYNNGYGNGYNNGYNPQNNGYAPTNNGYNPQNNGFNPQNGYNNPENNNPYPPYNNPPQGQ